MPCLVSNGVAGGRAQYHPFGSCCCCRTILEICAKPSVPERRTIRARSLLVCLYILFIIIAVYKYKRIRSYGIRYIYAEYDGVAVKSSLQSTTGKLHPMKERTTN